MRNELLEIRNDLEQLLCKIDGLLQQLPKPTFVDFLKTCEVQSPEGILPFELYDYASKLAGSIQQNKNVAILASRQMGVTTLLSLYALYSAISTPNQTIFVLSSNFNNVGDIRDRILKSNMCPPDFISNTKDKIVFKNGSIIKFTLSTVALRGYSPTHVIFDNAGYVSNVHAEELFATLNQFSNAQIVIGTSGAPHDYKNFFLRFWYNPNFKKEYVSWQDNPKMTPDRMKMFLHECGKDTYLQFYLDLPDNNN